MDAIRSMAVVETGLSTQESWRTLLSPNAPWCWNIYQHLPLSKITQFCRYKYTIHGAYGYLHSLDSHWEVFWMTIHLTQCYQACGVECGQIWWGRLQESTFTPALRPQTHWNQFKGHILIYFEDKHVLTLQFQLWFSHFVWVVTIRNPPVTEEFWSLNFSIVLSPGAEERLCRGHSFYRSLYQGEGEDGLSLGTSWALLMTWYDRDMIGIQFS